LQLSSPAAFAAAVDGYRFADVPLDPRAIARLRRSLDDTGLVVVGEPHGVRETPAVLRALARELGTRALAFEWSHEEVDGRLLRPPFDFDALWRLPPSAEFFCGDGRITPGHFALLRSLEPDAVIAYDRLDPEPPPPWQVRDRELAERLLAEWDGRTPLLVLTGAFHARLSADDGDPLAAHLARARPGLAPAMLHYERGSCWSRGRAYDVSGPMPASPVALRLPEATPADVPGQSS
jgi:hypothetical protein